MSDPGSIDSTPWHARPAGDSVRHFGVEPRVGHSAAEAGRRLERDGPNRLIEAPKVPWWRAFLRQFQDLLIVILLVAAVVSLLVSREWETPAAIVFVVLLNAVIGFAQESRAQASLDALRRMSVTTATVRRDGRLVRLDAGELVPGDVVVVEPGDRVPADGRLLQATSLEVQESMLTGEAQPVAKSASAEVDEGAALGDRVNTVYMNTAVTRGRGEVLVTATGMRTEMGRIAHMLHGAQAGQSPLQRQINTLSRTLAVIAAVVIAVVFILGLVREQQFSVLFVTAVSLAVAAIPEGLPAVVAFTLAMGTGRLARRGAIVKRLASVETLGSTSQICTDKTGTLTLNQMTAREMLLAGRRFTASGERYATDGRIRTTDGSPLPGTLNHALLAMALCSEAALRDGDVVGDPTEGALVVLAEKGGIDVAALREERPRVLEIPFDSDYKFMATFHRWTDDRDREVVRCFVKGAPDVLSARADRYLGESAIEAFDAAAQARYEQANAGLAAQGMRVMAIGVEDFPATGFDPSKDPKDMLDRLVLVALVGIVDPPRPEARQAIAECRSAGIRVRMITGDHAVTAAAIAGELGIPGQAVTGADLDAIDDDAALARRLDDIGVVARVSPSHKIRIVRVLQDRGDVVAMTGDGVNDAPALRKADIGVAMGMTGTEVTKEAATMVLTDDNFATIVAAVREGRGVYANIVSFTRFQVLHRAGFRRDVPDRGADRHRRRRPVHGVADPVRQSGDGRATRDVARCRTGQRGRHEPAAATPSGTDPEPGAAAAYRARQHGDGRRHPRRARVGPRTRSCGRPGQCRRHHGVRDVRVLPGVQPDQRPARHTQRVSPGDPRERFGVRRHRRRCHPLGAAGRDGRPARPVHHHRPDIRAMADLRRGRRHHPDRR